MPLDAHRERIGVFENAQHRGRRADSRADAQALDAIARAQGTCLANVGAANWITLIALLSHVGNLMATPHAPSRCQTGVASCGQRALSRDSAEAVFNVTGIVEQDFRSFCISTDQSAGGRQRHACKTAHIAQIKRGTDGSTVYAIGRQRDQPVNVLSMRSMCSSVSAAQHFSLYSRHRLVRNMASTYRVTLGVDVSRKGAVDFMQLQEKSTSGAWRSAFFLGRDSRNRLRFTRPAAAGNMQPIMLANLNDFGIRLSDFFTLLVTVHWQGADSSIRIQLARDDGLVDLVNATQMSLTPPGTPCVIRFGSDDTSRYRASFGLEHASARLAAVNLHSLTEHHCSF